VGVACFLGVSTRHATQGRVLGGACVILAIGFATGCATNGPLGSLRTTPPYEAYVDTLRQAGLDQTALGLDWTAAGERALSTPVDVTLPFNETGYLAPAAPAAVAYRMPLVRGRQLIVDLTFDSAGPARVFVDLFEVDGEGNARRVASLEPEATSLVYDVRSDGTYLLRVQPELLRGGRFTIVERTVSTLRFPVTGRTASAVQSGFGAVRDGGTRGHEGVDIFAPRGTPVAAVTDGVAQVSTNNLGGNVVWLREGRARRTFYYAHLDGWAIEGTVRVRAGDVLGYVGNTGNARTTAPHLHFGIYEGGAIDPLPFIQPDDEVPPAPQTPSDRLGTLVRVSRARTALRVGPDPRAAVDRQLERAAVGHVVGVSQAAVRLMLPDGTSGYVDAAAVASADAPLRRARLAAGAEVRETPSLEAPVVATLDQAAQVEVVGQFGGHDLVRMPDGDAGWVAQTPG
jgi:murein DD-endopeptidase MepM/ murein hydrolase activator NlpD